MNKERYLLVISGPAGSGKDTVVHAIMGRESGVELSPSATTRAPRPGEVDGVDYYFISREAFEGHIRDGDFLEYTQYVDNYYGTLKSEVDKRLDKGVTCVLVIEVEGAANIKRVYPECTTVFLMPPSQEELERRLRTRGSEPEENVQRRLAQAQLEMKEAGNYDYIITNEEIDLCAEEILTILRERQNR